ncbi:MAG: SDR family NAD(P)-dependent oxidoreductase, partial [Verrucomicrobiota bacterium]
IVDYSETKSIVEETEADWGPIDILVNNAGISYRGAVEDMSNSEEHRQMQVNYFGPMNLIRACLPCMRRRKQGRIINVSSVGGMMAMPTMASYSASKFALEGASESLWYELKPWNIKVTLVRPGFINSLAFTKVQYPQSVENADRPNAYAHHYLNMTRFVEKLMKRTPCTSLDVARSIYKATFMKHPPLRMAGTPDASLFYFLRRILPRWAYHKLLYISLPGIKDWGKPMTDEK